MTCHPFGHIALQTYESNLEYILRFMVDTKLAGAGWVELPAGAYAVRAPDQQTSHCQLEVDIRSVPARPPRCVSGLGPGAHASVVRPFFWCADAGAQVEPHGRSVHRRRVVPNRAAAHLVLWSVVSATAPRPTPCRLTAASVPGRAQTSSARAARASSPRPTRTRSFRSPTWSPSKVRVRRPTANPLRDLIWDSHDCTGDTKPTIKNIFTLGGCAHIAGAEVLSFDSEEKMLLAWRDFVVAVRDAM